MDGAEGKRKKPGKFFKVVAMPFLFATAVSDKSGKIIMCYVLAGYCFFPCCHSIFVCLFCFPLVLHLQCRQN